MKRFILGTLGFVGVMMLGYLLGIHPTFAEVILVAVASGVSSGISEALR